MWSWIKRVAGSILGAVLIFLSFGDAPQQLRNWKDGWDWFVKQIDWSGSFARWTFLIVAALLIFWAWDVPTRVLQKVRPEWLAKLRARLSKRDPVEALEAAMMAGFDHIDEQFTKYATKEYVEKLFERLQTLELATGNDPLQKVLMEQFNALRINSARYDIGEQVTESVDVKETLVGYINDNRIDILVNNDTMKCEPFKGQRKKLWVWYSCNGMGPEQAIVDESHKLVIPPQKPLGSFMEELAKRSSR